MDYNINFFINKFEKEYEHIAYDGDGTFTITMLMDLSNVRSKTDLLFGHLSEDLNKWPGLIDPVSGPKKKKGVLFIPGWNGVPFAIIFIVFVLSNGII